MVHVAGTNNNHVITEVVKSAVVLEVVNGKVGKVVGVTFNRLTHHVVTVSVVMAIFKGSAVEVAGCFFVLKSELLFGKLELGVVKRGRRDDVSKHTNDLADVALEASDLNLGVFAAGLAGIAGTHCFNFLSKIGLAAAAGAAGEHSAESVGNTSGGEGVLAGTSTNVDTDCGSQCVGLLSANTDSVGEGSHLCNRISMRVYYNYF
jgi:hypothetical protein